MITSYSAAPDIEVLTSGIPLPGLGIIPVNAFLLKGSEPLLVDTGVGVEKTEFLTALERHIDPEDLRWVWLTHTDFDHIGALHDLLARNPRLKVLTTYLGVGIMSLSAPLPLDRVRFVNPGETVTLGSRTLTAFRPPVFDNPSTTGIFEHGSRTLFSSDCLGALLQAVPTSAEDIPSDELAEGQVRWTGIDAPWLQHVDRSKFAGELDAVRRLDPALVLSSHLPAAPGRMLGRMLQALATAPDARPFAGPTHEQFEAMLATMAPA